MAIKLKRSVWHYGALTFWVLFLIPTVLFWRNSVLLVLIISIVPLIQNEHKEARDERIRERREKCPHCGAKLDS